MRVGIHIDPHGKFDIVHGHYTKILDFNGIDHIRIDIGNPDFWQRAKEISHFIFHYYGTARQHQIAHTIIPIIEKDLGVRCFPNSLTSWLYDDKLREYYFLQQHSFPVVPTWIFWDKSQALEWLETASLPVVFKLKGGASSENVVLVSKKSYGKMLVRKLFGPGIVAGHVPGIASLKWRNLMTREHLMRYAGKLRRLLKGEEGNPFERLHRDYILFQKFLPDNIIDTRVTVIGKRASGDIRYIRSHDFRASGSGKWDPDHLKVDCRCVEIAFNISRKLDLPMMCFDFLFDEERRPLVSEMSYMQPDWAIWKRPGYWDDALVWHAGHYWPQYFILQDLLKMPDLKQPDMKPEYLPPGVSREE